jgi:hypothetical protein
VSRMEVLTQLVAAGGDRASLSHWCLSTLAPRVAGRVDVHGLIVNLAQDNPLQALYSGEPLDGDDFDVIVQTWVPSLAAWCEAFEPIDGDLANRCSKRFDYRATDLTVKHDDGESHLGTPAPGYKLMRGLVFHADLGPPAARRQWVHHAKLALRVHVGVARYVQHWVDEPLTPDAPAIGGFSELYFSSLEAMRDRYFDSQRGKDEILHDLGHFMASGSKRFYGQEYRIK